MQSISQLGLLIVSDSIIPASYPVVNLVVTHLRNDTQSL